jgi:hypothetical protein
MCNPGIFPSAINMAYARPAVPLGLKLSVTPFFVIAPTTFGVVVKLFDSVGTVKETGADRVPSSSKPEVDSK